ncbi:MAG: hypothetical protein Tsb0019_38560 [Roseibium sp.]
MTNTLSISVLDKSGTNIRDFLAPFTQGLFSTHGMGTELLASEGTALFSTSGMGTEFGIMFSVSYTTSDSGVVGATGLTVHEDGKAEWRASFSEPQPLFPAFAEGQADWTAAQLEALTEMLLADTRFDITGRKGNDFMLGTSLADRIVLKGGDDVAAGGDGDDIMNGGRGDDFLAGQLGDDRLSGGADNDMLIAGPGDDVLIGGAGNDILVMGSGQQKASGGIGSDVFIFDTFGSTAGGSPNVQTRVKDFSADDLLVLADFGEALPESFAGETLADVEAGTIDSFQWRETKRGVEIKAGEATVLLQGVAADEIDLDQLVFSNRHTGEIVTLFGGTIDDGTFGHDLTGNEFIAFGEEASGFIAFGSEGTGFVAFGEEGSAASLFSMDAGTTEFISFGAETEL